GEAGSSVWLYKRDARFDEEFRSDRHQTGGPDQFGSTGLGSSHADLPTDSGAGGAEQPFFNRTPGGSSSGSAGRDSPIYPFLRSIAPAMGNDARTCEPTGTSPLRTRCC